MPPMREPWSDACRKGLLGLLLLGAAVDAQSQETPSFIPSNDSVVLEQLVARRDPSVHDLRVLRLQLQDHPSDAIAVAAYARRAIAIGREQADPRYFGYAASALTPWDGQAAPPDEIAWLQAVLQQQRHDFDGAVVALDALLKRSPYTPAYLTRATMRMVQGQPRAALSDCAALTRASVETAAVCAASARSLTGQSATALSTLDSIIPRLENAAVDQRLWATTTAAEIATRQEHWDQAQQYFDTALLQMKSASTQDPYLLTAYADFLLLRGRDSEVIDLLRDLQRIDTALLRLALAEQKTGGAALAEHVRELQARFTAVRERGDTTHGREETWSALELEHDVPKALTLAQSNWQVQREPIDARLLLQSATAARRPDAAQPVIDWMRDTGIEDPALHRLADALGKPQ